MRNSPLFSSLTIFRSVCAVAMSAVFISAQTALADDIQAADVSLTTSEQEMIAWLGSQQAEILSELKRHVDINTGTANIAGLDEYRNLLETQLIELGFATERRSSEAVPVLNCAGGAHQFADHLVATRKGGSKNRILLNGHMDTVFAKGDEFQTLSIADDGTLKGPGVADMKGGIVVMIYALRAIERQGLLDDASLTVLLNSDEEIGSLGSRSLIEELARQHDIGMVFEGSSRNLFTRARKGLGQVRIRVSGRESHSGGAHANGVSANLELAHKIIDIEKLTDYEQNVTVNVGVMAGGEKRNTIPGCADAYIDMRFPTQEHGLELKESLLKLAEKTHISNKKYPELPKTESWAILHRPAKQAHPEVDALIAQAMGLSKLIGEPVLGSGYSGGGTDGSLAQAVGLATIDSLGLDGSGAHSSREESSVASLMARVKLAAVMLARQIEK